VPAHEVGSLLAERWGVDVPVCAGIGSPSPPASSPLVGEEMDGIEVLAHEIVFLDLPVKGPKDTLP
jgi:hypothetical protein